MVQTRNVSVSARPVELPQAGGAAASMAASSFARWTSTYRPGAYPLLRAASRLKRSLYKTSDHRTTLLAQTYNCT